jgi:hypothetical protein
VVRRVALLTLSLLAACAGEGASTAPRGGCTGPVTLRNEARQAVEQFYASPTGPGAWGQDLLAPNTLAVGGAFPTRVPAGAGHFRVVFVDGSAAEIGGLDPCQTGSLTVTGRDIRGGR